MDYEAIYDQVNSRGNDSATVAVTVAKAEVNHAYQDVCTRHPFNWLVASGTSLTVDSQVHSVISDDISDLWKILSIRETDTPQMLTAITRKKYEEYMANDPTSEDEPDFYCDEYDDRIYWYHTPDIEYSMYVTYWKKVTDLSDDANTPVIPAMFHEVLVLGGLYRFLRYKKFYAEAEGIRGEYESLIQKMIDAEERPDLIEYQQKHLIGRPASDGPKLGTHYRRY